MRVFYQVQFSHTPGYGHRIWIKDQKLPVGLRHKVSIGMGKISMWGGADKADPKLGISWEFGHIGSLTEATSFLNALESK